MTDENPNDSPLSDAERVTVRLSVLQSVAIFGARRTGIRSAEDVLIIADRWLAWIDKEQNNL